MTHDERYRRLSQRVRARRRVLDRTQAEVALACGTGFQQIQKYEAGAALSVSRLLKIAARLQISPTEVLERLDA